MAELVLQVFQPQLCGLGKAGDLGRGLGAGPEAALLLAAALLLGGCTAGPQPAESAQPEETLTQEQIDAISEKYGLESPTPHTPPMDMDWGWSVKNP